MSRSGLYVGTVLVLALAVAGYVYWTPAEPDDPEPREERQDAREAPSVLRTPVTAARARRGELVMQITNAAGIAEAQRVLNIAAEVEGRVAEIPVSEGQQVRAGDILVRLDDSELELERQRAEEQLLNAVMTFAVNQLALPGASRSPEGAEQNGGQSAREFLEELMSSRGYQTIRGAPEIEERLSSLTREDLLEAQAQLTSQAVALRRAELDLERATIIAPFEGRLAGLEATSGPNVRRWPVVGQRVAASTELMLLVDDDPIELRVEVIESQASLVREGRRAEVRFSAFPGEIFAGRVRSISSILDPDSNSLAVTVTIPNADGRIRPGMSARVRLDTEIFENRLLVPRSSVLLRQERPLVFVVRDGIARWVYIQEGLKNDRWVEVLEGIDEGDQVVTGGHLTLAHDAPVTVVEELPGGEEVGVR